MDFKENIGKEGEALNVIMTANRLSDGSGFMIHPMLDQSGFKNVVKEDGSIDAKKAEKIEPEPNLSGSRGAYVTNEEMGKYAAGGNAVVNPETGNMIISMTATMKHGHGKFDWIPDPDNISGKGYGPSARETTYDGMKERIDASRENAAAARAVEKGLDKMPTYEQGAPEAAAPEASGKNTEAVATAAPAAQDAPAKDGVDLSVEDPF